MISIESIMSKLESYARSVSGKKVMKEYIAQRQEDGRPLASGEKVVGEKEMVEAAKILISIIKSHMPSSIESVGGTLNNSRPKKMPDGSYEVQIGFDGAALHRESLYSDGYDGIDNIVALLNNGYHARNYVYGWWDGHKANGSSETIYRSLNVESSAFIRSQKDRDGLHFMQQAVAEFNDTYGEKYGVTAILGGDYKA